MATDPFPDLGYFQRTNRQVTDRYNLSNAQNEYQRSALTNSYNRNLSDLTKQFNDMRQKLPYGYASRGLMNSGIYQKGLADYYTNRNAQTANLQGNYNDQLAGIDLNAGQLQNQQQASLQDLADLEAERRQAWAKAQLAGLVSY